MSRLSFLTRMALAAGVISAAANADPSVYPTGVTRYDPARAYNSYTLFTGGDNLAHLIDMNGNLVHEWKDAAAFSTFIDPSLVGGQKGHVLLTLSTAEGSGTDLLPGRVGNRISKTIGELDWSGKTVWQFGEKAPGGLAQQHHDWARLPNGNSLVLANLVHSVKGFKLAQQLDDVIYEVSPGGEVVWTWLASDHLTEFGFTKQQLALVRNADTADYLHLNTMKPVGPNHWFDEGDKRFDPANILIGSRNANFIAIIDRTSGRIVWSIGPNYAEDGHIKRALPKPVDQISGQHDAQIIPQGLPGAGNLLVFDNHGEGGYPAAPLYPITGGSRILEIDPIKKEIVWQYTGEASGGPYWSFISNHISSARRLPNGNTLIDEGERGRVFQVTPDGDIVWEYVNPYVHFAKGADDKVTINNQLYRAQPVPYSWVPDGTAHSEHPVAIPNLSQFHVSGSP